MRRRHLSICHINLARGYRGGERQTELLIRALAGRGVRQRLLARRGEPLAQRLREAELPALEIREIERPFLKGAWFGKDFILHAHEAKAAHLAWWMGRMFGMPYLITRRVWHVPKRDPITRRVYQDADALVAVAGSVAQVLRVYAPGVPVEVIHSACSELVYDPQMAQQLRAQWPGKFLIVNVAALEHAQKGQLHLLHVAAQLAATRPEIQFVLVGDGKDRAQYERLVTALPNIALVGYVGNVGDYLAMADAFVLPSLHEGIGGILLDAMQYGLPVVASAVDGVPEIVRDGVNGILVPPADEPALAAAILRIHDEAALRERFAAAGRKVAQDHLPIRMAHHYLGIYERIAQRQTA
jgi:glycosyltransferase involved in cell wall biosynthesis